VRKGLVVEQAEECRKVGGRGGFGVAFLESGLDALENSGSLQCGGQLAYGLQCGNLLSNWRRKKGREKKSKMDLAYLLLALQIRRPDLVQLLF
jgi:hypothetical protein